MKPVSQVASPPAKALLLYDGDCDFCTLWIGRWRHATGDKVDYLPYQDPLGGPRFPEIPRAQFESAVQLVQANGVVLSGAEAVFGALAFSPHGRWLLDGYQHSSAFARAADWSYRLVARHRPWFSALTRLFWGRHVAPPSQVLVRWAFLRCLGIVYLIAFGSLWGQISGLIGSNGIVPARLTMEVAMRQATAANLGLDKYHYLPTLCWFSSTDGFLQFQCAAGTALAVLLIAGIAPAPCLFLLWSIYLSLVTVSGVFLGFQWDALLLETGFLAVFFAPLQLLPRRISREAPPSRIVLWLLRWLFFRLMFESGCVKLLGGDATWRNLTALAFHYETQPLPTWVGWYAHQFPLWIQKSEAAVMFAIELAVPFLIFAPRRPRQFAALLFTALQLAILLTGNYGFFNLLTLTLCLTLLDDAAIQGLAPRWRHTNPEAHPLPCSPRRLRWPAQVTVPLGILVLSVSCVQLLGMLGARPPGPEPVVAAYQWLAPFRSFNTYGLFAVMTTSRPEIIIEGSNDGSTWAAYEFRYKAGDLKRRPGFVAPHQPRLDWQMWFAALGEVRYNPWLANVCIRLLEGSPEVLALLERNPFPNAPPRYLRATVYEYRFTDPATRRKTGEWWSRERTGVYLPPISLRAQDPTGTVPLRNP